VAPWVGAAPFAASVAVLLDVTFMPWMLPSRLAGADMSMPFAGATHIDANPNAVVAEAVVTAEARETGASVE
jgi:hypothetical protein